MLPYYCNEALLMLPRVRSIQDRTRQDLAIVTEEGTKLTLVIARAPSGPDESIHAVIDKGLKEQQRGLLGFQLIEKTEVEYGGLLGVEVKVRWIDKTDGPIFHYVFHTKVGDERIGFFGISTVADAGACAEWMVAMLSNLKLRS